MTTRIAINGFGRIGRLVLRSLHESRRDDVELVRSFDGYLEGQGAETPFIPVPAGPIGAAQVSQMVASFHEVYERRFGKADPH